MVQFPELLQAIYDELKVVVQDNTSVSEPDAHVGVLDRSLDLRTPYFGFDYTTNELARGMGGNVRTRAVNKDNSGNVTSVDRVRDYELIIDFGVTVDGDEPRTRDEYITDIQRHWAGFIDKPMDLHSDVERIRERGLVPSGVQGGDVGVLLTYEIEFVADEEISIDAAETVNLDVDADGTDAYPEEY